MTPGRTRLSVSVTSDDAEVLARAADHFSRVAVGLALDGMTAILFVGPDDEEDEEA